MTSEILVVFAIAAVTATNVELVGDELDPFDPLDQFEPMLAFLYPGLGPASPSGAPYLHGKPLRLRNELRLLDGLRQTAVTPVVLRDVFFGEGTRLGVQLFQHPLGRADPRIPDTLNHARMANRERSARPSRVAEIGVPAGSRWR